MPKIKGKRDVIVAVHGYNQTIPQGYRPWEDVVRDRMSTAIKVASYFQFRGLDTELVISGGTVTNGVVEADAILEWSKQNMTQVTQRAWDFDVYLEKTSKNTKENAEKISARAKESGAGVVISVSSMDHMPRIVRDYRYALGGSDIMYGGIPTKEPYSERGWNAQPAIFEPPFWAFDAVSKVGKIPPEKRAQFSADFAKVVDEAMKG